MQSKNNQILFDLPSECEIQNVIEKSKDDALNDAKALGLIDNKKINKIDLSCPIKPSAKMRRQKKIKINKVNSLQRRFMLPNGIQFEHINLKNFAEKFNDNDIDENSGFVEVFINIHKRIIVKKTSLCWLLRNDYAKLSSDRLERVKENNRNEKNNTHIYNLRAFSRKKNKLVLYKK